MGRSSCPASWTSMSTAGVAMTRWGRAALDGMAGRCSAMASPRSCRQPSRPRWTTFARLRGPVRPGCRGLRPTAPRPSGSTSRGPSSRRCAMARRTRLHPAPLRRCSATGAAAAGIRIMTVRPRSGWTGPDRTGSQFTGWRRRSGIPPPRLRRRAPGQVRRTDHDPPVQRDERGSWTPRTGVGRGGPHRCAAYVEPIADGHQVHPRSGRSSRRRSPPTGWCSSATRWRSPGWGSGAASRAAWTSRSRAHRLTLAGTDKLAGR